MAQNYVLLERIELAASAASVTFSNIPQTGYSDLKVEFSVRNTADINTVNLTINGVTTNQTARRVMGTGSSAISSTYTEVQDNPSGSTANVFGSGSLYIPNYTSSNNKSMSFDIVSENNATLAYTTMEAWLWSSTAAITSLGFEGRGGGTIAANSTFSLYGLAAVGTTPAIAPKASGGNIIENDGTYWIHTFTSSGTFTPQVALTCDYLVIAGGGGGASNVGGGGGAGGYRAASSYSLTSATTVTIGAGGAAGQYVGGLQNGLKGSNSSLGAITSTGGGLGDGNGSNGGAGGSGGGGDRLSTGGSGNQGGYSPQEGYSGGNGYNTGGAAGGGGASAAGSNGQVSSGGNGGSGTASSITGSSVTRAGGGGGSSWVYGGGSGGTANGGGGQGADSAGAGFTSGTANTGGGGGGATNTTAGAGGSGVVIIRYPIA